MTPLKQILSATLIAVAVGSIVYESLRRAELGRKPKNIEIFVPNIGDFHLEVHEPTNEWWTAGGLTNSRLALSWGTNTKSSAYEKKMQTYGEKPNSYPPNAFITMDRGTVVLLDSKTGNLLVYENGKWSTYERKLTNAVSVIHSTGPASIVNNPPRSVDERMHDIANSYFRMGQQAALMARDISENKAREVKKRYGYFDRQGESYTNHEDFEIVTERVDCIDHPRIWEIFRKLNDGSVLGLNTNSQCQWTNSRPWTVLKD